MKRRRTGLARRIPRGASNRNDPRIQQAGCRRHRLSAPSASFSINPGSVTAASDQLTILDVVSAVDRIARIDRCPLGLPDHLKPCPLHAELDEAISQIEKTLAKRTIAELFASRRRSANRCDVLRGESFYES